ncbi:MAG: YfhO family protein [Bacteroidota bacterium]|nr:YfhO family protein [Bacteroidota bacterium]
MKLDWKKITPHLIALGIFLLVTVVYFWPEFQGKALNQHDTMQWRGSYEETLETIQKTGHQPLWTNSMFSGMPTYQIGAQSEHNYSYYINQILRLGMPHPAGDLFLLCLGFYILMLTFGMNSWLAFAGAIAYAFSSYNFINIQAGHGTKVLAVAVAPFLLAGINLGFRGKYLWAAVLTALGLAAELFANHVQITYYTGILILFWGIAEFIVAYREKRLPTLFKGMLWCGIGAAVAIGMNITNLMVTNEYGKETIRGKSELTKNVGGVATDGLDIDYATQWSNGKLEPMTALISDVYGGGSSRVLSKSAEIYKLTGDKSQKMPAYFGPQPMTSGPIYFGAAIVFLFTLGMFVVKTPVKWALFAVSIFAFLLSMGKNFMGLTELMFDYFPLYNKFRAVTMTMVIAQMAFPILAMLAVKEVLEGKIDKARLRKALIYSVSIIGGICAIFILMPGIFLDFTAEGDKQNFGGDPRFLTAIANDRESLVRVDAFRSLVFISLAFGVLWLFMKGSLKKQIVPYILAGVFFIDLFMVDWRYMNHKEFVPKKKESADDFVKSQADEVLIAERLKGKHFRVLDFRESPFNDAKSSFYHHNIGGYHGAKLRRYQELKDYSMNAQWDVFNNFPNPDDAFEVNTTLNMLNCKYLITKSPEPVNNKYALGNAWFVNKVEWAKNPDDEINKIGRVFEVTPIIKDSAIRVNGKPLQGTTIYSSDDITFGSAHFSAFAIPKGKTEFDLQLVSRSGMNQEGQPTPPQTVISYDDSAAKSVAHLKLIHNFDPKNMAVVDERFKDVVGAIIPATDSANSIKLLSYAPDKLIYESNNSTEQLAIFSEVYYSEGWKATIDGKDAPIFRANYILRGLKIPGGGKHKIEFVFDPQTWKTGEQIAMVSSFSLLAGLLAAVGLMFRKRKKNI